jgi:ubiquinone/menaquinone biosynthesis C-methylase UbiE
MDELIPQEIRQHYSERYDEARRLLDDPLGQLELARTQEIILRSLPPPPARILDVGGGPGVYAEWLTGLGYEVHLIDPVVDHVQAAEARGIASSWIGEARSLPHPDNSQDAVLLLGPLYHLTEFADRITALREARRVTRSRGPIFAAAISRFAPAIDSLDSGFIDDPDFLEILENDIRYGQHRNPTETPMYFTTAYMHRPRDLEREFIEARLRDVAVFAVEGIAWAAADLEDRMSNPEQREALMKILRSLEREESLLGASPHLLAVATA